MRPAKALLLLLVLVVVGWVWLSPLPPGCVAKGFQPPGEEFQEPSNDSERSAEQQLREFWRKLAEKGPIGKAVNPLVDFAVNADKAAITFLEINAGIRHRQLHAEAERVGSDRIKSAQLARQIKAHDQVLSKIQALKRKCSPPEPKPDEDWVDPFFAILQTSAFALNGEVRFALKSPAEPELEPESYIITPHWAGSENATAPAEAADILVRLTQRPPRDDVQIELKEFALRLGSFSVGPAGATGPNVVSHWKEVGPGRGSLSAKTGRFDFRFEAALTNRLTRPDVPALCFVHAQGVLRPGSGEAVVSAHEVALFPAPPGHEIRQRPAAYAAGCLTYDHSSQTLKVVDYVSLSAAPHLSMLRRGDGSYAVRKEADPLIGEQIVISPMKLKSRPANGVFLFEDVALTIRQGGRPLIQGRLTAPVLDDNKGTLSSPLMLSPVGRGGSPFAVDFEGPKLTVLLARDAAAFDLVRATNHLTRSTSHPLPTILYLESKK